MEIGLLEIDLGKLSYRDQPRGARPQRSASGSSTMEIGPVELIHGDWPSRDQSWGAWPWRSTM